MHEVDDHRVENDYEQSTKGPFIYELASLYDLPLLL